MHQVTGEQKIRVERLTRDNESNGNENEKAKCLLMRNNISNQEMNNKNMVQLGNASLGLAAMADANEKLRSKSSTHDQESNKQFKEGFNLLHTAISSMVFNVVTQQIENTEVIEIVLNQDKAIKENKEAQKVLSEIKANKVSTNQ